jgi:hypothetical protein
MKFNSVVIVTLSLLLISCGNYVELKKDPSFQGGDIPRKTETSLDFATIKTEVLDNYCINCHTGRHNAYENYAVVKAAVQQIAQRVTTSDSTRRMPKAPLPALPDDIKGKLLEWIGAGAPEFKTADGDDGKTDGGDDSEEKLIGFSQIKTEILKSYNCVSCHSQFNDYATVRRSIGSIVSLVSSNKMPFPKRKGQEIIPVSDEHKNLLLKWVAQGTPEFEDIPAKELPLVELQPTWESLRNNVIGPKCILCHNSFGPRAPTDMATYKAIQAWFKKSPSLFNFEDPEQSHFIGSIIGRVDDDEFFFDTMPFNNSSDDIQGSVPAVTEDELNVIRKWIELKLPFNEEEL